MFQQIVKKFEHIDIMVNNAGIGNEEDWERTIDVNLKGLWNLNVTKIVHKEIFTSYITLTIEPET